MKTWKKGAVIGGLWGFVSWIYAYVYIFMILDGAGPGFKLLNSTVEKILLLPAYIHHEIFLPFDGWLLLLLLPFLLVSSIITILIGLSIGLIMNFLTAKYKLGRLET